MMRSANEIAGMVLKAARGAGVPLGHAEDLAHAAAYLAGTNPNALGCVGELLKGPHLPATVDWGDNQITVKTGSVIMYGPAIADAFQMGVSRAIIPGNDGDDLLVAILGAQGHRVNVIENNVIQIEDDTVSAKTGPINVPDAIWAIWDAWAAKTYVPATEESRITGAGAGLTDND